MPYRGGMEKGMNHWKSGKMMNKKNTFFDFISCTKFLIDKKYTVKKNYRDWWLSWWNINWICCK